MLTQMLRFVPPFRCATYRCALLIMSTWAAIGCASAPRNPVLDKYPANVNGRTTVDYYDVHGRTLAELRADMRRNGPRIADSGFVAETRSPMRWSWKTEPSGVSMCTITNATVSVNAQILLPRWTPPADTEPGLLAEWNRFITALETHEAGHKDISAKAARELAEKLREVAGPCSQINTRASDIARTILDRANAQQKAYDAETRHGLTQGTSFGAGRSGMRAAGDLILLTAPRVGTVRGSLPIPVDQAWRMMPAVFSSVGLSINASDSVAHAIGDSLVVHGKIAGLPAGDVVDCGAPPAGRNADSVAVSVFVTSRLEAGSDAQTWMVNTVQAFMRPEGSGAVTCRSRGLLERRLLEEMRRRTLAL